MKKIIIIIISFLLAATPCMAQNSYLEFDSISYAGVKIIDQGKRINALSCHWQKSKNNLVKMTPYEVKSYAIGKAVYDAKDIEINGKEGRFFLEKMVSGKLTLYFIKNKGKHFFVERDNVFSALTKCDASGKNHYRETLQALGDDCEYTDDFVKRTWYNRYYLKRFVKRYNDCEEIYRPVRFGAVGGWDMTGYFMLKDAWDFSSVPTGSSFTFGCGGFGQKKCVGRFDAFTIFERTFDYGCD
jgi:hypothetical protein